MSEPVRATTADYLNRYRTELLEGGMPDEMIASLILDAAHELVANDGLCVRPSEVKS